MRCSTKRKNLLRIGVCVSVLALAAGCGSGQKLARTSVEVERLRERNDQFAESLAESRQTVQRLRREVSAARNQHKSVSVEAETLRVQLATAQENVQTLKVDRADAIAKIAGSDKSRERLRQKLGEVQDEAEKNVEELADLRQEVVEYDERITGLRSMGASLRKEFSRVNRQLERARSEVMTKESVIHSMTTGDDGQKVLSKKLSAVEAEKRELVSKYDELVERLQSQGQDVSELTKVVSSTVEVPAQSSDSRAPASESLGGIVPLVKARAGKIFSGDAAWDGVDVTLTVASVGVVFCVLWLAFLPIRMRKTRYLKDEIESLHQKVYALANADREHRAAPGRQNPRRLPSESSARPSSARPRGQFSAIISNQSRDAAPVPEEHDGGVELEQELQSLDNVEDEDLHEVTVNLGRMAADLPQPSDIVKEYQEQAKSAAPESSWDDDDGDEEFVEDDFANTQVIPSLGDLDRLDDDLAAPPERSDEKKNDREFMAELKDLIGKKVDEMIQ